MLNLSGDDVPGFLENALVSPVRIQRREFVGDRVMLAHHDQVKRRQVCVFVGSSITCTPNGNVRSTAKAFIRGGGKEGRTIVFDSPFFSFGFIFYNQINTRGSVHTILHGHLHMSRVCSLTPEQKSNRVEVCEH